jgi:hypothetical protein
MRGRWPQGPEYVDKLQGSDESKERLKAIFDTLYGQARLREACAQLDLGETRFHQLREIALQGALTAIEPRPAGRPSRASASEAEQIRALQARVRELEQALHEAQVREEIALVLPHLGRPGSADAPGTADAEGKKTARERVKVRKRR